MSNLVNLEAILNGSAAYALGWTLIHFLWQGAAITLLLWIVLQLIDERAHELRYIAGCVALGILLLLPAATFATLLSQISDVPASSTGDSKFEAWLQPITPRGTSQSAAGTPTFDRAVPYVALIWSVGASFLMIRLFGGWYSVRRRTSRSTPAPGDWQVRLDALASRAGILRTVRLHVMMDDVGPCVVGWLRPIVLVPVGFLTGLPAWQIEAVLAHELAHVKRCDYFINVIQSIAEALLFYHPGIWWVSNCIRTEREYCCDDVGARSAGSIVQYARALVMLEEYRRAPVAAPAGSGGSLRNRIERMLGERSYRVRRNRGRGAVTALLMTIAMTVAVAACTESFVDPSGIDDVSATDRVSTTLDTKRVQYLAVRDSIDAVVASTGVLDGEYALKVGQRLVQSEAEYVAALASALERTRAARPILTQMDAQLAREMAASYREAIAHVRSLDRKDAPMDRQLNRLQTFLETVEKVARHTDDSAPGAGQQPSVQIPQADRLVSLTIDADGHVHLDGEEVDVDDLEHAIVEKLGDARAKFEISVAPDTPMGTVSDVQQKIRRTNAVQIKVGPLKKG